jgi:hypothetical protein
MKPRFRHTSGGNIVIRGGRILSKPLALIVCRCLECLGPVEYHNNGLACAANKSHRGLIHRDEAAAESAKRAAELLEVETAYIIKDGQLVALDDHTRKGAI